MKYFGTLQLLCAALLACQSTVWAQGSKAGSQGNEAGPQGTMRSNQRSDLRRDVMEEQTKKVDELNQVQPLPRLTPQQRAELRRQLREQDDEAQSPGRPRKRP